MSASTSEERFREHAFLSAGETYDWVSARDAESDDQPVVLKAIRVPDDATAEEAEAFQELLTTEAAFLSLEESHALFPRLVARTTLEGSPVLALERVEGLALDQWLAQHHPEGAPLDVALPMLRELFHGIGALHAVGWVGRTFRPDHVRVTENGLRLHGSGRWIRRQGRPTRGRLATDALWSAPEIERETSGTFLTPRADVYGLSLLMAFWLTNTRPTGHPETPLTPVGWERLGRAHEGIRLLVAHGLQPFHKHRLANAERIASFLELDALPTSTTPGFGEVALLSPWKIAYGGVASTSKGLSPGPLVSRPGASGAAPEPEAETDPTPPEETAVARHRETDDEHTSLANTTAPSADTPEVYGTPMHLTPEERAQLWVSIVSALVMGAALLGFVRHLN